MSVSLKEVKCIQPSDGMSSIADSLMTIGGGVAGAALVTALGAIPTVATGGAATPVLIGAALGGAATGVAIGAQASAFLNKNFSGSDDLYIRVNGDKIWPSGKSQSVDSQESVTLNYRIPDKNPCTIQLMEYDTISDDDDMGTLNISAKQVPNTYVILLESKDAGSSYLVTYEVLPNFPMKPGYVLARGYPYYNANLTYRLEFQNDGNLCVKTANDQYAWGLDRLCEIGRISKVQFNQDGNLVALDSNNAVLWQSDTQGRSNRASQLVLDQNTGKLSIVNNGQVIWTT